MFWQFNMVRESFASALRKARVEQQNAIRAR
jgi:hypothetical protein